VTIELFITNKITAKINLTDSPAPDDIYAKTDESQNEIDDYSINPIIIIVSSSVIPGRRLPRQAPRRWRYR
jgi:hypothetical protein